MNSKNRVLFFVMAVWFLLQAPATGTGATRMSGHLPRSQMLKARHIGRKASRDRMRLALGLKIKDPEGLAALIKRQYDPNDSLYQQFLTPAQFAESFSPSTNEVNQVVQYMEARGLHVLGVHPNRLVVEVEGETSIVENAFQVEEHEYLNVDGRTVHAATEEPLVGDEISGKLSGITGLNNFNKRNTHRKQLALGPRILPTGSYITPARIKSAYGLGALGTGTGETLALFELDTFTPADITAYANYFSITAPPITLQTVSGGVTGSSAGGMAEVTLDIELAMAVAPGVSQIIVYEGPNSDAGVLATYSKIANDNTAKTVSTSWGAPENQTSAATLNAENTIFQQMAAQGQTIFAASGDSGAYDDSSLPTTLEVDDPGSQPYVTSVGGTTLTLAGGTNYSSEVAWGTAAQSTGGGGGISRYWAIPSWQSGMNITTNGGSSTKRMVPDVAFNANTSTGYYIYSAGAWVVYGGTSCAAPIWAAYMALVNQHRVANGLARIGFVNPSLYQLGQSSLYSTIFHDITSGNNLFYNAVSGYDLATGWGSFIGAGLYAALSNSVLPPYPPASLTVLATTTNIGLTWPASTGATTYSVWRSTASGGGYATVATGIAGLSYTDATAVAGTTYYYYITAVNAAGSSGASTIGADTIALVVPGAPTALTATVAQ